MTKLKLPYFGYILRRQVLWKRQAEKIEGSRTRGRPNRRGIDSIQKPYSCVYRS